LQLWRAYASLGILLPACAVWMSAALCRRVAGEDDVRVLERAAFRRVMLPLFLGVLMFAFLTGWAFREPDPSDEGVRPELLLVVAAALSVVLRALIRAASSVLAARVSSAPVATVGLVACRVLVADAYRQAASAEVLSAALAHEAAHAKAHDPLRIWLAQFATDLQWPIPAARRRLRDWLFALELLRDDEALAAGTSPTTLAESILLAARLHGRCATPAAGICGEDGDIALRIRRLLADDVVVHESRETRASYTGLVCCFALCGASLLGAFYGELVLAVLPRVQ
jgi:hypothetical protein